MFRNLSFIILSFFLCFIFSGCYDSREVDDEVYTIAIGIDKGVENKLRLTIQYPTYQNEGGEKEKKSSGVNDEKENEQPGSNIHTLEVPTILEGIDMFGMAVSRKISLMHTKMIVFSEELAREGIIKYIAPIKRYRETRSTMSVIVVKGKAEDYLLENKSNIGQSIVKATELMFEQSKYTGYFPDVKFIDFYKDILSPYEQAIAIYGGVNNLDKMKEDNNTKPPLATAEGFIPGEMPRRGVVKRELTALAAFNGDKMVGYLDSYGATYYLMIIGKFKTGAVTIEDKNKPDNAIVFDMRNNKKLKVKAYFKEGKPVIDIKISMEADIESIQSRINYEDLNMIKDLEKQLTETVLNGMNKTVEITQKEFKSDIFGFGHWMVKNFATIQEWEDFNWFRHYPEAKIDIDLEINISRTGTMINSSQIKGTSKLKQFEGEANSK